MNGGEWSSGSAGENEAAADAASLDDSDGSFGLPSPFHCFSGGQEKDASEEMLDLESICGNTLAEKIANAENDIRNKDQIRMRGLQEQQQCPQSDFLKANSSSESNQSCADNKEEGHMGGCNKVAATGHQELLQQTGDHGGNAKLQGNGLLDEFYGMVGSPLADCLTENSVDFMTAENNSSSAESSIEFGDADNSLEFDDMVPIRSSSIMSSPCDDSSVDSSEVVLPAVDSNVSAEGTEINNAFAADASDNATGDLSVNMIEDASQNVTEDDSRVSASDASCDISKDADISRDITASTSNNAGRDVATDASNTISRDASQDAAVGTSNDASQEMVADASSTVPVADCSPSTLKVDTVVNNCKESGEVLCENVPTKDASKFGDKCNNGATELENDPTTMDTAAILQKTHSLANGDVADGDNLTNCGKW